MAHRGENPQATCWPQRCPSRRGAQLGIGICAKRAAEQCVRRGYPVLATGNRACCGRTTAICHAAQETGRHGGAPNVRQRTGRREEVAEHVRWRGHLRSHLGARMPLAPRRRAAEEQETRAMRPVEAQACRVVASRSRMGTKPARYAWHHCCRRRPRPILPTVRHQTMGKNFRSTKKTMLRGSSCFNSLWSTDGNWAQIRATSSTRSRCSSA